MFKPYKFICFEDLDYDALEMLKRIGEDTNRGEKQLLKLRVAKWIRL